MPFSLTSHKLITIILLIACGSIFSTAEAQQSQTASSKDRCDSDIKDYIIPFELHNNHIYLRVSVNNSEPLWFILDTGAETSISKKRARTLGLKSSGKGQIYGSGEKPTDFSFVEKAAFNLSGIRFSEKRIAVLPLEDGEADEKHQIDGLIGESFFERFVVEIDYATQIINLYTPKQYKYSGRGETFPLERAGGGIFVEATVKPSNHAPIKNWFHVDTGGAHALILNTPFVKANKLLTPEQQMKTALAQGIGTTKVVVGTVEYLQMGRFIINSPSTLFSQASEGFFAGDEFSGTIGGAVLSGYKVIFDYSRRRMILESYEH
jgi:hypothetical protein